MKRTGGIGAAAALCILVVGTLRAESFPGFSLTPPPRGQWVQVQRNARSLVWMRRTRIEELTVGVAVLTQPMHRKFANNEEFLEWVISAKSANPEPETFKLVSNNVRPSEAEGRHSCVSYTTIAEDSSGGPAKTLRLEVVGLACLHPEKRTRYYDIQYFARMPVAKTLPAEMAREGQQFVESFRFSAPPPDGDWSLGEAAAPPGRREAT